MFHRIIIGIAPTDRFIMFAIPFNQKRENEISSISSIISLHAAFLGHVLDEISINLCSFCPVDFFRLLVNPQKSRRKKKAHKNIYSRENRTIINKQPNRRKI